MKKWINALLLSVVCGMTMGSFVALTLNAQQPVVVTAADPAGPGTTSVGSAKENALRTHQTGIDPTIGARPILTRLTNAFGLPFSDNSPLPVAVKNFDPCNGSNKASVPISQTTNTRLVIGSGTRLFICSALLVGADAENVSFVEGTGTTCGAGTLGVLGGATAANGPNLAANGGFAVGNGSGAVFITDGYDLCLFQSGSGRVAGVLTYAKLQ